MKAENVFFCKSDEAAGKVRKCVFKCDAAF